VVTAAAAFAATNVDDFAVLLLIAIGASPGGATARRVVAGQYLGFTVLVLISLAGAAALHSLPGRWVGLLGLVPLALGIRGLVQAMRSSPRPPIRADNRAAVALVTIASGGDNISVYVLLFRQLDAAGLAAALVTFAVLLGVWCAAALAAGGFARLVPALVRAGHWLSPCLFIAIGVFVLVRTGVLTRLAWHSG
jgi:cadmium resistance protein CadD (predicted permease)